MPERVFLRPLRPDDLPTLHRWYQTAALWDHLVGDFTPREAAEAIAYMDRWLEASRVEARLAIERAEDRGFIGLVTLSPIDREAGEAEFHIFLGDAAERGQGFGAAATAAMLSHAFDELGLWRITLKVLRSNEAALRVYAAMGFEPEPEPAGRTVKRGQPVEIVAMTVTDAVFRQRQAAQPSRRWAIR